MHIHDLTIKIVRKDLSEKKYSSVELTTEYLNRIKKLDEKLHAFVTVTEEKALSDARKADAAISKGEDAPLLGLPFTIKDNFNTKGIKTTASSNVLKDFVSPYNATVVERLEKAGIVMLGKTNMDAWAHGSSTETSDFGPSRNPWDINRFPGGSSGGAAAAQAADMSLAAIGSETAGSVRGPASWCGLVGLKPTYGRVSRYGVIAMASSTDSPGPIVNTVEDAALILEVLAGKDPKDATSSSKPTEKYSETMKKSHTRTLGISEDYFNAADKKTVEKIEEAIKVFEKKGHRVKTVKLFDPKFAIDVYTILMRSEVSSNLARYDGIRYGNDRTTFGDEAKRRIMLGTYALSSGYYDAYYKKAQKVRTIIIENFSQVFESVDAILAPTLPTTALKIGEANDPMFGELMDVLTEPSAIAGLCGINIPVGLSSDTLPVGMQIIGPQFGESTILSLAYEYEKENPFYKEVPNI